MRRVRSKKAWLAVRHQKRGRNETPTTEATTDNGRRHVETAAHLLTTGHVDSASAMLPRQRFMGPVYTRKLAHSKYCAICPNATYKECRATPHVTAWLMRDGQGLKIGQFVDAAHRSMW